MIVAVIFRSDCCPTAIYRFVNNDFGKAVGMNWLRVFQGVNRYQLHAGVQTKTRKLVLIR